MQSKIVGTAAGKRDACSFNWGDQDVPREEGNISAKALKGGQYELCGDLGEEHAGQRRQPG